MNDFSPPPAGAPLIEIVGFAKNGGGVLSKRITLTEDGRLHSDGSACVMGSGIAGRRRYADLTAFAAEISRCDPNEAIALGRLRADLPDEVEIVTKEHLEKLRNRTAARATHTNGTACPPPIARTGDYISYRPDQPALALIDLDTKGMPTGVRDKIAAHGDYGKALASVLAEIRTAGCVVRRSTSTGISRVDTGETLPGSDGFHAYVLVNDGADVERFLRTLHDRLWLAGLGWMMLGEAGQFLERSLADRMVYAPERLVFEGAPILEAPLVQDAASRAPTVREGPPLDTLTACPPLTIVEKARLAELREKERHRLAPERAKVRDAFISRHAAALAERTGIPVDAAKRVIERQCGGVLLPDVVLPFDDPELAGVTVADVLADPARFEGETLADPLEGVAYGVCKAKIMRRADGSPWIHSFAHGRTDYELKFDARAIGEALAKAPNEGLVALFVRLMRDADVTNQEAETLRDSVSERSGTGKRVIDNMLRQGRQEQQEHRAEEARTAQAAQRQDPRLQIEAPLPDAPWLPQMGVLNDVLGASTAAEPPMRDVDGAVTVVRIRRVPNMHALTPDASNEGETKDTRLPPPEQPLLTRVSEAHLAEMIERHIDYVDEDGRSVHLAAPFVRHFLSRADGALPTVATIATLPIVLGDKTLLEINGLDRNRGIVFRVPDELRKLIPARGQCTQAVAGRAMRFLCDEWLCDVATDYAGKCVLVAAALTIIERAILPERPVFFVTAGRRGGGKTTVLTMLLVAVTGVRPSAAAWSSNEEERRKALLAYLMEGVPAIVWDNIPRGTQISCPQIEKSCTSAFYSDRKLGVSELVAIASSAVHLFTGNNILPRGDLISRSLQARLEIDRPDPENRPFDHADPIGWTEANRGKILAALFAVLLANPATTAAPRTRFKAWWRLVGSAVENAARQHVADAAERTAALVDDPPRCPPVEIDFQTLFLNQEDDDEELANLADALAALAAIEWHDKGGKAQQAVQFNAAKLASVLNDRSAALPNEQLERVATIREFLYPDGAAPETITAKAAGKRLKRFVGEPVRYTDEAKGSRRTRILSLTAGQDRTGAAVYFVNERTEQ